MKYQYHLSFRWSLFSAVIIALFFGIWSIFAPVPALVETHYSLQYNQSFTTSLSYWWLALTIPFMIAAMIDLFYPWKIKEEWVSLGFNAGALVALILASLHAGGFVDSYMNTILEDFTRALYLCIVIYAISIIFIKIQFGKATFYFLSSALLTIALSSVAYAILGFFHELIKSCAWEISKFLTNEPPYSPEYVSNFLIGFLWVVFIVLGALIAVWVNNKMEDWGIWNWLNAKSKKPMDETS